MKTYKLSKQLPILACALSIVASVSPLAASAQQSPPAGSTLEQRIEQRKKEQPVTLDAKEQARLVSGCIASQSKVRTLQQTTTDAVNNRLKIYNQIDARLWVVIGKLKLAQKDTFELEKKEAALAAKIDAFDSTTQGYKQTLDDLALINCKADPAGFEALLQTAKLYNADIRKQILAIHDQIINEIKPALSDFATQLQGSKGDN